MKILTAEQIRQADQYTIEHEPIKSIDLMERASRAFVNWFEDNFEHRRVFIFCGTGNNGGDGLAISRMLNYNNWDVMPITIHSSGNQSNDFKINYLTLTEAREVPNIEEPSDIQFDIGEEDIVIDAIFGSGLARPVKGIYAKVIDFINKCGATVVSVDIPSGLFCDSPSKEGAIVKADQVVSFQLPKLAFMMPENGEYVKSWTVVDIGLHPEFLEKAETPYHYLEKEMVREMLKARGKFQHKIHFGRDLIIAGGWGKMGAAVLCTRACMTAGAGLVTAHIPSGGYTVMQTANPEVMVTTDPGKKHLTSLPDITDYTTIGIGPGIGKHIDTYEVVSQLLTNFKKPIVVDADAINILADEQSLMEQLPKGSVLTPHPGEFKRMTGFWEDDFERLEQQIAISKKFKIFLVLKGAHTAISTPAGKVFFNSTGNPGMATGGSGDVLTGIITSLLGQGYSPEESALLGTYLHGLAGDIGTDYLGQECLTANDIIDFLPQAFTELRD